MVKYNAAGTLLANKTIGGSESEYLKDVKMVDSNQFVLFGSSNSPISGDKTETLYGYRDYYIFSLDTNFNILWQKTFGNIGNDTGEAFAYQGINHYTLTGTTSLGLLQALDDFWMLDISNTLSTENFSELRLNIFPNPTKDILSFEIPLKSDDGLVYVFNSTGAIVQTVVLSAGKSSIDVSSLSPGTYFISCIADSGKTYSGQFVKE